MTEFSLTKEPSDKLLLATIYLIGYNNELIDTYYLRVENHVKGNNYIQTFLKYVDEEDQCSRLIIKTNNARITLMKSFDSDEFIFGTKCDDVDYDIETDNFYIQNLVTNRRTFMDYW